MLKDEIISTIKNNINHPESEIKIYTNDNKHFNAIIISDIFLDHPTLIQRQQLINKIISKYITTGKIHAFSFKTYTKNEWNDNN